MGKGPLLVIIALLIAYGEGLQITIHELSEVKETHYEYYQK